MKNMVIPRDFIYDRDALICYFENLSQFIGKKISQKQIQGVLQKQDPDNGYYTVLGRKITTFCICLAGLATKSPMNRY